MSTVIIRPRAAGDETSIPDQTPASGEHWDKVSESAVDNDATTVHGSAISWSRDLYTLQRGSYVGAISKIRAYIAVKCVPSDGAVKAKHVIKTHGTVYDGTSVGGDAVWRGYFKTWTNNPNTGTAWTWEEILALQAGVSLQCSAGEVVYCTTVFVEITYTPVLGTVNAQIWVEGDYIRFTDEGAEVNQLLGDKIALVGFPSVGHIWVDGNYLYYIDDTGWKRSLEGILDTETGKLHAQIAVSGWYLKYIDGNGDERYMGRAW